jgi:hypothetical protein
MDWYAIEVPSRFGMVNISLECEEELSSDELATEIRSFCKSLDSILEKAFNEIVNTMVPLKNDCWLDDDKTPISGEELLQAIQSKEISISLVTAQVASTGIVGYPINTFLSSSKMFSFCFLSVEI